MEGVEINYPENFKYKCIPRLCLSSTCRKLPIYDYPSSPIIHNISDVFTNIDQISPKAQHLHLGRKTVKLRDGS